MATQAQMFSFTPPMAKPADEAQAEISRLKMELHNSQKREGVAIQQNRDLLGRLNAQTEKIKALVGVINQLQAQQASPEKGSIPTEMWRRLVQLCHLRL